jgi:hypothetical protein
MTDESAKRTKERKEKIQRELDELIEDTIRETWLPNTLAWIVAVGGAFLINIGLLVLLTGS